MKRVLFLGVLFCLHFALKAQKVYFIYLQSESSAPFYVKMGGKIQSSTTNGYLILSKLLDSVYTITIGQPGKQEEPRFALTISRGDRGFLIKNIDGTTGLFDLQTLALYKPISTETTAAAQTVVRNDNFTKLLAKAADDTTLLNQPVVVQQPKTKPKEVKPEEAVVKETVTAKPETTQTTIVTPPQNNDQPVLPAKDTVIKKESVVAVPDTKIETKQEEPAPTPQEEYKRSIVTKKSEGSTSEGVGLVFLDTFNGSVDTIALLIPNQKLVVVDTVQKQPAESKQFLDITNQKDAKKDTVVAKTTEPSSADKPKSQCTAIATDDDFFKLRRDMAAGKNDEEMIAQAKKYFKNKCYRTEQIKYLSTLFLTDEGKYQFFDAAYRHVSDQQRFITLQSEIVDSYYVNRFKALIGN